MNSRLIVRVYGALPRWLTWRVVSMLHKRYAVGVVGIVINQKGEILVLKHTYHKPAWRLPGGLMEHGEQPFPALIREIQEEANCVVRPLFVAHAGTTPYSFDVSILAQLVEERPFVANAEIAARKWLPVSELAALPAAHVRAARPALELAKLLQAENKW